MAALGCVSGASETFDRDAVRYDAWFDSATGRVLFHAEVEAVLPLLKDLPAPLLEVGVGTGRFAQALGVTCGIDLALGALRLARARGIHVVRSDGGNLPFPNQTFGGLLLIFTLCFAEPHPLLREAKRVLKPEGKLILADVLRDSAWGRWYQERKAAGHPFYRHAVFYSFDELVYLLTDAGFAPTAVTSAITQAPGGVPVPEPPYQGRKAGASFVCLQAQPEAEG
jgi:SAM-dependent methyltransferase